MGAGMGSESLDIDGIRAQFDFGDRVVTNNAASTQPPRELLDALPRPGARPTRTSTAVSRTLRGPTTERFEASFDTIAGVAERAEPAHDRRVPQHHRGASTR